MQVVPGPFLQGWLDTSIREWRERVDEIRSLKAPTIFPAMETTDELKALTYIDALQEVRVKFIGSKLPEDG